MFLLLSIFVLVSVEIPEVAPVPPGPCRDLVLCLNDFLFGDNGTLLWAYMEERPAHIDWIDLINGTCNKRFECNTTVCTNSTYMRPVHYHQMQRQASCSPRGRQFLERIYTEAPQCTANRTFFNEARNTSLDCMAEHGAIYYLNRGDCANATAARDCTREWYGERCGDLFRWKIDLGWDLLFQVYFPNCPRPSRFAWPSG